MQIVDEGVHHLAVRYGLAETGVLTTRGTDTGHRRAYRWPGTTHVKAEFVDLVEGLLDVFTGAALEHHVTALPVQCQQSRTVPVPDIAQRPQDVGVIVHPGWRHDAQGMELRRGGKLFRDLREAWYHPTSVAIDGYGATLPVALSVLVGMLELAKQVDHHRILLRQALEPGHEARPGAALELIQHRCRVHLRHRRNLHSWRPHRRAAPRAADTAWDLKRAEQVRIDDPSGAGVPVRQDVLSITRPDLAYAGCGLALLSRTVQPRPLRISVWPDRYI